MKALLITLDDKFCFTYLPEDHRYGTVYVPIKADLSNLAVRDYDFSFVEIPRTLRTFQWRGSINRKDGTELLTFFEETK